jgi:hypothetical protein
MRRTNTFVAIAVSTIFAGFAVLGCSEMKDNPRTTGTIAGGATGAAVGAAIDKDKPAEGAIIGGAVGAGAGNLGGEAYKRQHKD